MRGCLSYLMHICSHIRTRTRGNIEYMVQATIANNYERYTVVLVPAMAKLHTSLPWCVTTLSAWSMVGSVHGKPVLFRRLNRVTACSETTRQVHRVYWPILTGERARVGRSPA